MLIFTAEGPRSIDDRDVLHVYRGQALNRFAVTLVMANGEEVSGLVLVKALAALEARFADDAPPPMAA
jgi:hypothetical protein